MVMSRDRNAERSQNVNNDNSSFERVEEIKYLGRTFINQTTIKSRLKSGNACYHSVKNRLSSSLLYKNLKIKIYRNITLPQIEGGK